MKIKEVLSEGPAGWLKKASGWDRFQDANLGKSVKKAVGWDRYQSTSSAPKQKQVVRQAFNPKQAKSALKKISKSGKLYRDDLSVLSNLLSGLRNRSITTSTVNSSQLSSVIKKVLDGYGLTDAERDIVTAYLKEI